MTDIVDQLRSFARFTEQREAVLINGAATEIERLRALLARVTDAYESTKTYDPDLLREARGNG